MGISDDHEGVISNSDLHWVNRDNTVSNDSVNSTRNKYLDENLEDTRKDNIKVTVYAVRNSSANNTYNNKILLILCMLVFGTTVLLVRFLPYIRKKEFLMRVKSVFSKRDAVSAVDKSNDGNHTELVMLANPTAQPEPPPVQVMATFSLESNDSEQAVQYVNVNNINHSVVETLNDISSPSNSNSNGSIVDDITNHTRTRHMNDNVESLANGAQSSSRLSSSVAHATFFTDESTDELTTCVVMIEAR